MAPPGAPAGAAPRQSIGERVTNFLGEFRIMVPALGALFGFQLIVAFQPAFQGLAAADRAINFAGVACTAAALLLLLVPASYHRFTSTLEETDSFLEFARRTFGLAFVFLPVSIVCAIYMQALVSFRSHVAAAVAAAVGLLAFALGWWLLPFRRAQRHGRLPGQSHKSKS